MYLQNFSRNGILLLWVCLPVQQRGEFWMRICPKCQTVNKNENMVCANCQEYIGAVPIVDDPDYGKRMVEHEMKRLRMRNTVALTIFLVCYSAFLIFFATVCYKIYGDLYYWLMMFPWYVPCLCLFIFPYNRAYQWILRKRNQPLRPLSENWTIFFRALAVACLFVLCLEMYNVLARNSPTVPY